MAKSKTRIKDEVNKEQKALEGYEEEAVEVRKEFDEAQHNVRQIQAKAAITRQNIADSKTKLIELHEKLDN